MKPRLPTLTELAETYDLETVASQGDVLSPTSAEILEAVLEHNPLDLVNRARLLGFYYRYYWKTRFAQTKDFRKRRVEHILWFIENAPDCAFASDLYLAVDKRSDERNYTKVGSAWKRSVKSHPHNPQIRVNAALFFVKHDRKLCLSLMAAVKLEDPTNAWVAAIEEYLGLTNKVFDPHPIEWQVVATNNPEDFSDLCDRSYLHHAFHRGAELSPISVETLRRVLNKYPDEVVKRLINHHAKSDVTLHHYTKLTDVSIKPHLQLINDEICRIAGIPRHLGLLIEPKHTR